MAHLLPAPAHQVGGRVQAHAFAKVEDHWFSESGGDRIDAVARRVGEHHDRSGPVARCGLCELFLYPNAWALASDAGDEYRRLLEQRLDLLAEARAGRKIQLFRTRGPQGEFVKQLRQGGYVIEITRELARKAEKDVEHPRFRHRDRSLIGVVGDS